MKDRDASTSATELPNAPASMYQRAMSHRPACLEPNPDNTPLADLCDSRRDTLQGISERRQFCWFCELTIMKGKLYFVADADHDAAKRINNTGDAHRWILVQPTLYHGSDFGAATQVITPARPGSRATHS